MFNGPFHFDSFLLDLGSQTQFTVLLGLFVLISGSVIYLVTRRWFWFLAFGVGAIVCLISAWNFMLQSEIAGALVFLFLAVLCGLALLKIREAYIEEEGTK